MAENNDGLKIISVTGKAVPLESPDLKILSPLVLSGPAGIPAAGAATTGASLNLGGSPSAGAAVIPGAATAALAAVLLPAAASTFNPAAPAAALTANAAGPGDTGGFFSRPAAKTADPKLLDSLVAQKAGSEKTKPILGQSPTLKKALEQEKDMQLKRRLRIAQVLFLMVFFAAGLMALYFYSELSPGFNIIGANTTDRLTDLNSKLRGVQKELNRDRYLAAQLELNQLSFVSDQYFDATAKMANPAVAAQDKQSYTATASAAAIKIPAIIGRLSVLMSEDLAVKTIRSEAEPEVPPEQLLQQASDELKTALTDYKMQKASETTLLADKRQEIRLADNAIKLVGNADLIAKVRSISTKDLEKDLNDHIADLDPLKRKELQTKISSILATTTSDIATITNIKNQRVDWLKVISQIESETAKVDKDFRPKDKDRAAVLKEKGGIEYTGFSFDSLNKSISINGTYKTKDSKTFTQLSDLINTLNLSGYFKDVEMRSFSKSGDPTTKDYNAGFNIRLTWAPDAQMLKDTKISLVKKIMAEKAMRKRLQLQN